MMYVEDAKPLLKVVDGALSRQRIHPEVDAPARRPSRSRRNWALWLDWAPMAILGASAGIAGICKIAIAITH